jgi:hypothetical protein
MALSHSMPLRRPRVCAALGLGVSLIACTSAAVPTSASEPAPRREPSPARQAAQPAATLAGQPVNVTVKKGPEVTAALLTDSPVLLRVQGIRGDEERSVILRVFLGAGVDLATSVTDQRFIGVLTVLARSKQSNQTHPLNAALELPAALRGPLRNAGGEVAVSLVPVGIDGAPPPPVPMSIESVSLAAQ